MNSLSWLNLLGQFRMKFGLERIERLISHFSHPEKDLQFIHIAGTNGKGSVSTMLASVLKEAGYKVGLYTSPHLKAVNERIQVDGTLISDDRLEKLLLRIKEGVNFWDELPTYFEVLTASAFIYFAEEKIDIAVIETGLGGRLDATNIIMPIASVITRISLEHTEWLGDTIEEIAKEKAGIIKKDIPAIFSDFSVIMEEAKKMGSPVFDDFTVNGGYKDFSFKMGDASYDNLSLQLIGDHQVQNAGLAIATPCVLKDKIHWKEKDLRNGLSSAFIPARAQIISQDPLILLDSAHNPDGASTLASLLKKYFSNFRKIHIVGMCADKDIAGFFSNLKAERLILTKLKIERAAEPKVLLKSAKQWAKEIEIIPDTQDALIFARRIVKTSEMIVICGSSYLGGEIL
jgi:dihydrofolate synthase/folylpolyglutamate synthase